MIGHRPVVVAVPSLPTMRFLLGYISGREESLLSPARPGEPTRLLAALLRTPDGAPADMASLPAAVHDRLLAEVYRQEIGEIATCRAACAQCAEPFEFELALSSLIAAQDAEAAAVGLPGEDGRWEVADTRVRPPLLSDTAHGGPDSLLKSLCAPTPSDDRLPEVAALLERASPLLALDLDASCPHCETAQKLGFDLPRFLAAAIGNERPFLVRETHLIASRYGWSHAEIMALPRADRRAFATLIESERSAAQRPRVA